VDNPFISTEEAATILGVSVDTIRGYINRKKNPLPAYRFGREYKLKKEEFEEWVQSQRVSKKQDEP
jgi:excisionase family DNA binding protein